MNTALVKRDVLSSLKADSEYRHAWNLENVYTGVCFQIRALREQREWSQATLGKAAKMAQERISILEDPNAETKPTLGTLLRIADAYDVGLDVRFVPYKTIIDRSTKTNMKDLEVPSFDKELPDLEQEITAEIKREEEQALHAVAVAYSSPFTQFTQSVSLPAFTEWIATQHQVSKMSPGSEMRSAELRTNTAVQDRLSLASYERVINIDYLRARRSEQRSSFDTKVG